MRYLANIASALALSGLAMGCAVASGDGNVEDETVGGALQAQVADVSDVGDPAALGLGKQLPAKLPPVAQMPVTEQAPSKGLEPFSKQALPNVQAAPTQSEIPSASQFDKKGIGKLGGSLPPGV